jgi:hypothetical protein
MFCRKCGTQNDDNAYRCTQCNELMHPVAEPQVPAAQPPPFVPSHMVWAILTTFFCCLPFGIVAIVYAANVSAKLQMGDLPGAKDASAKAKLWSWISFGVGLGFGVVCLIVTTLGIGLWVHKLQGAP